MMKYLMNLERLNYYLNISSIKFSTDRDLVNLTLISKVFSQIKKAEGEG